MLSFWSIMQSNGGDSRFLNNFLFVFLGLISYSCLYLDKVSFDTFGVFSVFGGDFPCLGVCHFG